MPAGNKRAVIRFLAVLIPAVLLMAVLLTGFQQAFSTGIFEYDRTTTLEGTLRLEPAPFLILENGLDPAGKPVRQHILLLGTGKTGALPVIQQMESQTGQKLAGKRMQISGHLIYHDGKTALEIESGGIVLLPAGTGPSIKPEMATDLGEVTLRGELTDPKCLLGVMKPGQGKPHRDCSVRCVAGGIPPVLQVTNENGESEYYLLAGPDGKAVNNLVLPFMADAVQICGRLKQQGDWLVLYIAPETLKRINKYTLQATPLCHP
jgi:hypothetical protein